MNIRILLSDVVRILDANENTVVEYSYAPWGVPTIGRFISSDAPETLVLSNNILATNLYVYINDKLITTTPEHPFWVAKKGWVIAGQLQLGDQLLSSNGAEEILVHNTCVKDFLKSPKKYKDVEKLLKQAGFQKVRQEGSHVIFKDLVTGKTVTVPNHGSKEIAKGTLRSILKQAGLL